MLLSEALRAFTRSGTTRDRGTRGLGDKGTRGVGVSIGHPVADAIADSMSDAIAGHILVSDRDAVFMTRSKASGSISSKPPHPASAWSLR